MRIHSHLLSAALSLGLAAQAAVARAEKPRICPTPWKSHSQRPGDCSLRKFTLTTWDAWTGARREVNVDIRSGYLAENPDVPFRGNVIYYQGLGDSMLNHEPLFSKLTQAGFRVIAFDYMGQGGSSGSMNDTRIPQIGSLGDQIWAFHARDLARRPKKNIVGWSTGGLAAYVQAAEKSDVDNIVLIAPGIAPNINVGEHDVLRFKFNQITLRSLTTQTYGSGEENPHVDPIKPTSPLQVMDFSWNLLTTAKASRRSPMRREVNGFVLLSGDDDTYVNAGKTGAALAKSAPHFIVRQYPNTLHEIDNEAEPSRSNAHRDILDFLNMTN